MVVLDMLAMMFLIWGVSLVVKQDLEEEKKNGR